MTKRRLTTALTRYLVNPVMTSVVKLRLVRGWALLETRGRKTGLPRTTPVGNGLADDGRTVWIVSEHGKKSGYVRNIQRDPRVRVLVGGRWRTGTAEILTDDDPVERLRMLPNRLNNVGVRVIGTDLLTVRVDLDPS